MRNVYSVLVAILFLCMLLLPLIAGRGEALPPQPQQAEKDEFAVLIGEEIVYLSAQDYITGVVAAEMPALYNEEALKAQAVAAYTYASYKRLNTKENYDITADSQKDQAYIGEAEMKEKWGENYDKYKSRIEKAVAAVCGQAVLYDDKPIFAAYHAISSGKTETAFNVWGGEYPYLVAVESVGDKLADGYKSEKKLSQADFLSALGIEDGTIGEVSRSESGTVLKITIGGKEFTGSEIRKNFSLRSANFSITKTGEEYCFSVLGYGHGVGLSQHGANFLAEQGLDYKQILLWYYKGCEVK